MMSNPMYDRAETNPEGLEIQLQDPSHLFRHASEITKETKGGYLQGKIYLPKQISEANNDNNIKGNYFLRLSLGPAHVEAESNPVHIHPLLLYLNTRQNRRKRQSKDGEVPEDVDWSFVLHVNGSDKSVHKVNYKTMVEAKHRFDHNRTGKYSGAKRGSEENHGKIYEQESRNVDNHTSASSTPGEITTVNPNGVTHDKPHEIDHPRSRITKQEKQLMKEYRERLMTADKRPFKQGPLVLSEGWSLSAKIATLQDSDKGDPGGMPHQMLELGSTGVMLNVITPLQKFTKGGITLVDVLWQRFNDLYHVEMSPKLLADTEDVFIGRREDRVKLQMVRLMVEVFHAPADIPSSLSSNLTVMSPTNLEEDFVNSTVSDIITNSKSKECGPLRLHDVNPACSCIRGNTKVFLLSFFKLVADIRAMFIVWNPKEEQIINNDQKILRCLKQPTDSTVFNQCVLIFTAPPQDPTFLREEIIEKGYELRITAWRPSDGRLSHTSFEFKYFMHGTGQCSEATQNLSYFPPATAAMSTEKEKCDDGKSLSSSPLISSGKTLINKKNDDECLICDLLQFKYDTTGKLPLAKPGVQRRADEVELKGSDDQKPLIQAPTCDTPSSTLRTTITSKNTTTKLISSTTIPRVPIPIAMTGGFSTEVITVSNSPVINPKVTVIGSSSSTHRQLVIGNRQHNSPVFDMSLPKGMPTDGLVPSNKISFTSMVPGPLKWKNRGDMNSPTPCFISKGNSFGITRLEKHDDQVLTNKDYTANEEANRKNLEVKIDIIGDGLLDGDKILSSVQNMKEAESSKRGIKLKPLEYLLKPSTVSTNSGGLIYEQDKPLDFQSHTANMREYVERIPKKGISPTLQDVSDDASLFKIVPINSYESSSSKTSMNTKKTTSLNHSTFSFVSSEKPMSTVSTPIQIPLSQEMRILQPNSPIPNLRLQIKKDELVNKGGISSPRINQPTLITQINSKPNFSPSFIIGSPLPNFDIIRRNSKPKLIGKHSEGKRANPDSELLHTAIPGIPTVVMDSINNAQIKNPPLPQSILESSTSSNKSTSPSIHNPTLSNRLNSSKESISSKTSSNIIDFTKGTLTIKMESEDIIALQPSYSDSENTKLMAENFNGTHLESNHDNAANFQVSNDPLNTQNLSTMPLSFQESRTPFSKRLEMLRRGISSSSNKLPTVITPNHSTTLNGQDESVSNNIKNRNLGREYEKKNLKRESPINLDGQDESVSNNIKKKDERKNHHKRASPINLKMRELVERETSMRFRRGNRMDNKVGQEDNDDPENLPESKKYLGKRLYIAEDNDSDKESSSNKRNRLDSAEDSDVSSYTSFIPIGPIPTILNQSSEEEKSDVKPTKAKVTTRRTRYKRTATKMKELNKNN